MTKCDGVEKFSKESLIVYVPPLDLKSELA